MHMSDALISPAVGGVAWAAAAGLLAWSIKKLKKNCPVEQIALMGVCGAFVFAAQMINFAIPGTGSSGHIAGGVLLAVLLGPYAGFLVLSCVLIIQALFFADGGLLALGCNIVNLGFWGCLFAVPFIYRPLAGDGSKRFRVWLAATVAVIVALQLGAASVVLETLLSGLSALTAGEFLLLMQPIHLAIGAVEGILTGALLVFLLKTQPKLIYESRQGLWQGWARWALGVLVVSLVVSGVVSHLASSDPDGLEWSMENMDENVAVAGESASHKSLEQLQSKSSFLPDYTISGNEEASGGETSIAGITGTMLVLLAILLLGGILHSRKRQLRRNGATA